MNRSEQINELIAALAKSQSQFKAVPKNKTARVRTKTGGEYTYKYADLADVLSMAIPVLSTNGIAFLQPNALTDGKLRVTTLLVHSSGQWMQSDGIELSETYTNDKGLEMKVDPQTLGGDISYFRRYDGCSFIGIAPDEDTDAQGERPAQGGKVKKDKETPFPATLKDAIKGAEDVPPAVAAASVRSGFLAKAKEAGWQLNEVSAYLKQVFPGKKGTKELSDNQLADTLKALSQVSPAEFFNTEPQGTLGDIVEPHTGYEQ